MSVFAQIDARLEDFAATQQTELNRDRHGTSLRSWGPNNGGFEERRIDWQRNGFRLAVVIQPDFSSMTVDTSKWHCYALAWEHVGGGKRVAEKRLVSARPFAEIEAHVDELLAEARTFLDGLQRHDLRPRIVG